jgi:threonylcarbamoyladenosine tRNA methylthiotransferase MtaB
MSKVTPMNKIQTRKKAVVHVLGCKVNQAETAAMAKVLEDRGYEVDPAASAPDLVLVNTCCVTEKAEGKSRRMVARLAQRFPGARLVVTGCLAEINPCGLEGIPGPPILLGTFEKDHFGDFLDGESSAGNGQTHRGAETCRTFSDLGACGMAGRGRAFLKIQDGCSQMCSYCIVPKARGRSRSLPTEKVVEYAFALAAGHGEIVLTGINLGSYGRDLGPTALGLDGLLELLLYECADVRFRLSSIEPQQVTPRLLELAAEHPRVCPHFHIPLQSGDDEILSRMRRPYDSMFIRKLTATLLKQVPEACIGFDVMVGFPGEDDGSFERTRGLIEGSGAAYLHVFPFSPRPGTLAASFRPRVPRNIVRERVGRLRSLSVALRTHFYECFLGEKLMAVPESGPDENNGTVLARTDNYIPVRVHGPVEMLSGCSFAVKLERFVDGELQGVWAP